MTARALLVTIATLVAFAANSILTRLALRGQESDPASFTAIRLISGALALWLLIGLPRREGPFAVGGAWRPGLALLAYAVAFSLAYLQLPTGTGALVLFGSVQATMTAWGIARGERPSRVEWLGLAIALGGLVYLVLPGLTAPPFRYAALMATAGVAWGAYSVLGRAAVDPAAATAGNFARAAPVALLVWILTLPRTHVTVRGLVLGVICGAVTSAMGYVLWYHTLRHLTVTRAAIAQIAVPPLVALGGIAFLGEAITARLALASAVTLGGVGLAVFGRTTAR